MNSTPIRQLRIQVITAIAVIMVSIWGAVAYQVVRERQAALGTAAQNGRNLSSVVAEHFSSYAGGADLLLQRLRIRWIRDPKRFAEAVAAEKSLRKDAFAVQVAVIGADGWLAYTDLRESKQRVFLGDREHFNVHRGGGPDQLYISNPVSGRVSGKVSIQFTRPVLDRNGKFAGVLVLSVSPQALIRVYEALDLGSNGLVGIRRLDNTRLLRWPDLDATENVPSLEIPSNASTGNEIRRGNRDGVERLLSYRKVPDFPLYAVVGQSLDSLLVDFSRGRLFYLSAGASGSLVVLMLGLMMLSSLKRGEHVENELVDSERRFRSLTGLSSDMYWEQDDQYRFTSSSGSGPEWIVNGKKRWDFKYDNMSEADWAAHIALLDARKPFRDLELCRAPSGRKVWVSVSGEPIFDASGAFKGYRGVGRAITERKRAEQLQSLEHTVSRSLAEADSVTAAVQAAVRAICETEGWESGRYFRWDDKAHMLRFADAWGVSDDVVQQFLAKSRELSYAAGVGLAGKVWQSRQPLWASDITQDTRVDQVALARGVGMRGAFVFPVISEGNAIGVLAFNSREIRESEERLMQAISVIGTQIGQFLQRKQREEELRRFRTAMDASEDMIWLLDPVNMKVIDINDTACRKLGYTREELLSLAPQDVISISREELSRIYTRLIQGGEGDTAVGGWYRRKDGSRFPVEAFRRAVQSEGSHVIVAVVRDVTERRAAEEELRRFRLAMDNSADMIVLIDRATMRFVDVNETACKLLGYSREELLRMGPQDVLPVGREDLERSYDELIARPAGSADAFVAGMKSHYVCKDGSLLPFESTRHVLRSEETTLIAAISRDIRARLAIEEKVSYLAQFDALTGLPNRNLFQDRLTQAMALAKRNDWPMAVLFIDLDRFKLVNDTLGHGAGDKLLKEAAGRLRSCVRASDTVGRLGGDEFAAILSELARPGDAGLVAQKIIDVFKRPFDLEGKETYVTASVGVTLYPADTDNAEALVVNADAAMYRAKEQGRNNYQYFTRDMNERAVQRVQMEIALRRALEREEFRLFYQPKADLVTGKICGFEALLRWEHPDKGMVLPGEFIPVLEETGLIVQAGEWVLRTACVQIKAWQEAGLKVPSISVNLSARQFEQKNLKEAVGQILGDTKVDPSLIEFEITESLLMNDPEGAARTLHSLKESGVKLSMDDFGTGYSSLGYLKRFPIDTLKIDRTFVRDISTDADDATLTRAIINLAQNLRLNVVAEGVETEAQLAFLCLNGCDEMQGYLFARPTTGEECGRMLGEGRKLAIPPTGRKEKSGVRRAQA
ncbi:MAG TPA: EAL domain-containing protein [Burkholderiales bacterium]|nr:EAL domain-containing protein [Burkholderiales bacterium]